MGYSIISYPIEELAKYFFQLFQFYIIKLLSLQTLVVGQKKKKCESRFAFQQSIFLTSFHYIDLVKIEMFNYTLFTVINIAFIKIFLHFVENGYLIAELIFIEHFYRI